MECPVGLTADVNALPERRPIHLHRQIGHLGHTAAPRRISPQPFIPITHRLIHLVDVLLRRIKKCVHNN